MNHHLLRNARTAGLLVDILVTKLYCIPRAFLPRHGKTRERIVGRLAAIFYLLVIWTRTSSLNRICHHFVEYHFGSGFTETHPVRILDKGGFGRIRLVMELTRTGLGASQTTGKILKNVVNFMQPRVNGMTKVVFAGDHLCVNGKRASIIIN